MHFSNSPLIHNNGNNQSIATNNAHNDTLTVQRYGNQSSRLSNNNHNRMSDDDMMQINQSNLAHSHPQSGSPGTIFYSHSPEHDRGDSHSQHHVDDSSNNAQTNAKYQETLNETDSLPDFVSLVYQETHSNSHNSNINSMVRSPKVQASYPQYSSMLPPPPLPPMARPVAIIRSTGDLSIANSPPNSVTSPLSGTPIPSPHHHDQTESVSSSATTTTFSQTSPPLSPQSQSDVVNERNNKTGLTRITSPYLSTTSRDYPFNHFHPQHNQVIYTFVNPKSYTNFLYVIVPYSFSVIQVQYPQ